MRRPVGLISGLLALALLAAGCTLAQGSDSSPSAAPPESRVGLGGTMTLDAQEVAPGAGSASIDIRLPEGWHVNVDAPPFQATWTVDGKVVQIDAANQALQVYDPQFPLSVPVTLADGSAQPQVELVLYYCNDDKTICTIDRRTVVAPLIVSGDASASDFTIAYTIVPPQAP